MAAASVVSLKRLLVTVSLVIYESKNKALNCFYCHKEGHFKRDCPERKNKPKDANNINGNVVVASEESDEGYDSAGVLVASNIQTEGKWVLDSGCTYHMCPHKHLFSSYQSWMVVKS